MPVAALAQDLNVGCGAANHKPKVLLQKQQHPTPTPASGKALIYVVRIKKSPDSSRSQALKALVGVNGKWVGGTLVNTYSYFEVEPGLVSLCSIATCRGEPQVLALTAEAGQTYYLQQWGSATMFGAMSGKCGIKQLSEQEAKPLIEQAEFATLEN